MPYNMLVDKELMLTLSIHPKRVSKSTSKALTAKLRGSVLFIEFKLYIFPIGRSLKSDF